MNGKDQPRSMTQVLNQTVDGTDGETVSLGDILDTFGTRSYGPALLFIALIAMIPFIGGIPGMSIFTGTLVILLSAQLLFQREHLWLPKKILGISFARKRLTRTVDTARPWAKWLGKIVHPRLPVLVHPPFLNVIAAVCILLAVLFFPLALVPFGVFVPALGVFLFGLALTAKDGLLALIGLVVTCASIGLVIYMLPTVSESLAEIGQAVGL